MTLDTQSIRGLGGRIYAHVLGGRLDWAVNVESNTVLIDGAEWETSVACECLHWPIGSWKELSSMSLTTCSSIDAVEASFYLGWHHPIELEQLEMERVGDGRQFRVDITGRFDLKGFGELDGKGLPLKISSDLEFEGIVVVPDNLTPKPATPDDVKRVVERLIDVDELSDPQLQGFRYLLAPI